MVALPAPESGSAGLQPTALPHELESHASEWEDSNLRSRAPKARALPLGYTQISRNGPARTDDLTLPKRALYLLSYIPMVEMPGIEPGRQRLQGATATSASHPHRGRMLIPAARCSTVELSTGKPVREAKHGRKESNPLYRLWRPAA